VRFVLFALALCVSGCGGCVDDSGESPAPIRPDPGNRPVTVGPAKISPRIAQMPNPMSIRDAGDGDE
jgi:hypothetical protein